MVFGGFQKLTLLDFPGKVACILFTKGCNFLCPFCHNSSLVHSSAPDITEDEVLEYLAKRQGILEGVCISGGEPLIHDGLEAFIRKVRDMGYAVKLDTNGSFPDKLKHLADSGLIDYVAMDIKNSFEKYPATSGKDDIDISKINESIDFLMSSGIDYEFRTTVVAGLHTPQDIVSVCRRISGAKRYFLQNFVDSGDILENGLNPMSEDILDKMLLEGRKIMKNIFIRGKA